jgi:acetyl-CoA acetyltransferase
MADENQHADHERQYRQGPQDVNHQTRIRFPPMPDAYVIEALRTPMGAYRGALSGVRPDDLAAHTIAAVIERTGVDPERIADIYLGAANQSGEDNRDVARMAALLAGLPHSVPGATVNRLCASGLEAINCAARAVRLGEGDFYLAGGVRVAAAPFQMNTIAPPSGEIVERGFQFARFAVPRRVYTQSHMDYVVAIASHVVSNASKNPGYRVDHHPDLLGHFFAKFAPLGQ